MTEEEKALADAALKRLDEATAAYEAAVQTVDECRDALHAVIVELLRERTVRPGLVADHSPYDRNHIRRIAEAAGVPPLRERTVKSARDGG